MAAYLLVTDRQRSVMPGLHAYSPYGFTRADPAMALGFCGQYRDSLTGNYPLGNGHRFYSPILMRFMSPDRLSPFSKGGINGYAYCGADPVNRHDPSGAFWSAMLRTLGFASSGATLFGALMRTAKNVVGRRAAYRAANPSGGRGTTFSYDELPQLSRVANQQLFVTGVAGVAGQVAAAVSGVRPALQTVSDAFSMVNSMTNLSGGLTGNISAAREVGSYLWANPREVPGVMLETIMDVTMLDEMLSFAGHGLTATAARIRNWSTRPHEVQM